MSIRDYKAIQKVQTELNADGNEERGRYGEDESSISPAHYRENLTEEEWIELLETINGKHKKT